MSSNVKLPRIAVAGAAATAVVWALWLSLQDADQSTLTLYGNVDIREVQLGFRVPGRLVEMDVDEGDRITSGQRVARIDAEPYGQALAVAEARVRQAQANLDKLRRGPRPQEVQQAKARVREARAAFDNAERDYARQRGLAASGATSQQLLEAARSRRDQTAAVLTSAREALALAQEGSRREDIAAGEAELAAAIALRAQAQTQLDDTTLNAPSDAVVLTRVSEPGTMLAQGAPVYTLSLRDPIYVRAYVSEPHLGRLAPGATVYVTTDSSNKRYRGKIGFISPRAEFTPRAVETTDLRTDLVYRLRIVVDDADPGLHQGMPVTVTLPPPERAGEPTVPDQPAE